MKKISLNLLTLSMLALPGCLLFQNPDNSVTPTSSPTSEFGYETPTPVPGITTTPIENPTVIPTSVQTSVPTPSAVPVVKTGGIIKFVDTSLDWGTLGPAEKARFTVQDFEHRRVVYREVPADPSEGGEFEFTWDAPPSEISESETITLNINTKNNTIPANHNVNSTMEISFQPNGFFQGLPTDVVKKGVGWFSGNAADSGTNQIKLKPVGINDPTWNENTKITIYVSFQHGPTLYYNYRLLRN